jgi:hypothetical protein
MIGRDCGLVMERPTAPSRDRPGPARRHPDRPGRSTVPSAGGRRHAGPRLEVLRRRVDQLGGRADPAAVGGAAGDRGVARGLRPEEAVRSTAQLAFHLVLGLAESVPASRAVPWSPRGPSPASGAPGGAGRPVGLRRGTGVTWANATSTRWPRQLTRCTCEPGPSRPPGPRARCGPPAKKAIAARTSYRDPEHQRALVSPSPSPDALCVRLRGSLVSSAWRRCAP